MNSIPNPLSASPTEANPSAFNALDARRALHPSTRQRRRPYQVIVKRLTDTIHEVSDSTAGNRITNTQRGNTVNFRERARDNQIVKLLLERDPIGIIRSRRTRNTLIEYDHNVARNGFQHLTKGSKSPVPVGFGLAMKPLACGVTAAVASKS